MSATVGLPDRVRWLPRLLSGTPLTGPHRRQWDFWCGHRVVHWEQFWPRGCDSPHRHHSHDHRMRKR